MIIGSSIDERGPPCLQDILSLRSRIHDHGLTEQSVSHVQISTLRSDLTHPRSSSSPGHGLWRREHPRWRRPVNPLFPPTPMRCTWDATSTRISLGLERWHTRRSTAAATSLRLSVVVATMCPITSHEPRGAAMPGFYTPFRDVCARGLRLIPNNPIQSATNCSVGGG